MAAAACPLFLLLLLALLPKPGSSCNNRQIRCRNSDRCVWIWETCDGEDDCGDNTDEDEHFCMMLSLGFDFESALHILRRSTTTTTTTTTTTPAPKTFQLPTSQFWQEMEESTEDFEHKLRNTISHPDCPQMYTRVGSLCMSVMFMAKMKWLEARTFCSSTGGHLLTLSQDAAAYTDLLQYLSANGITEDFWLGGRWYPNETGWQWLDDTPVQMGSPYWAVRHEAQCMPRTLRDLDNQTTLANHGACYHYQQAPSSSTGRHCLAATFRHYWHLSDEDCGEKRSPLCVRPEGRRKEAI